MNDTIVLFISSGALTAFFIIFGIALSRGRGADLIAGYNTMSKEKKAQYDMEAICKFYGKIMIILALPMPLIALGGILDSTLIFGVFIVAVLGISVFAAVYGNTGDRFKK